LPSVSPFLAPALRSKKQGILNPGGFKLDRERRDEIETVGDHQLGSISSHS